MSYLSQSVLWLGTRVIKKMHTARSTARSLSGVVLSKFSESRGSAEEEEFTKIGETFM